MSSEDVFFYVGDRCNHWHRVSVGCLRGYNHTSPHIHTGPYGDADHRGNGARSNRDSDYNIEPRAPYAYCDITGSDDHRGGTGSNRG